MSNQEQSIPYGYTSAWAQKDKYRVKLATQPDKMLRLGLVGLGGVALGKHLPAIRRLQETGFPVTVVAGAEIDDALRAKTKRLHGFPCYSDFREMFDKEKLDGVQLLTDPGESRLQALREAVDRDLHLFVEKPFLFFGVNRLDESISLARKIVEQAKAKKLVVMTGFVKRFSPPYAVAKRLVDEGAIGRPSLVAIKMCQGWSRHILLEGQACHLLHVALWLAGPISRLHAYGINRYAEPNYPYDNVVVNVEYSSGAIGTMYFNSSAPSLKPWERFEVFGERKWLVVEDGFSVTLHESEEGPSKNYTPVFPHTLFFDEEFSGFVGEIQAFAEAIEAGREAPVTGEDGINALVLARMIHIAIEQRRDVTWAEMVG